MEGARGATKSVQPLTQINNQTIMFNFPREKITISSGRTSIKVFPLFDIRTQHLHYTRCALSSVSRLLAAALHHSWFSLSASFSIYLSHPLVDVLFQSLPL